MSTQFVFDRDIMNSSTSINFNDSHSSIDCSISSLNSEKHVQFLDEVSVVSIEPLFDEDDSKLKHSLFYSRKEIDRFRLERNMQKKKQQVAAERRAMVEKIMASRLLRDSKSSAWSITCDSWWYSVQSCSLRLSQRPRQEGSLIRACAGCCCYSDKRRCAGKLARAHKHNDYAQSDQP